MARTAGDRHSWLMLTGLFALATAQGLAGCDETTAAYGIDAASLEAMLTQVGEGVITPAIDDFAVDAAALQSSTAALAALTYGDEGWEDARALAQQDWLAAMGSWQRLEVMQVGPAAPSLDSDAGVDLRDAIYSWPSVNPCRVDQETVLAEWDEADFFETRLINVVGLDAMETLLFAVDTENDCPGQVDINSDGSWDALGDAVWDHRSAYASALADELVVVAGELQSAWVDEDHTAVLASGSSPYDSQQAALNAVFDALFYLELRTENDKIAPPLGLGDCTEDVCTEDLESPLAGDSHVWVRENLTGFQAMYLGADGDGFDDLLQEIGQGDVDDTIQAQLAATIAAADALEVPLQDAPEQAPDELAALYEEIKVLAELLDNDLSTVLSLTVPAEVAGDND